jgi:peptide chain release factor subunit 1
VDGEYLPTKLQEKIIAKKDLGYADEHGLKLLVESSQDILASQEIIIEKKLLEKFFNTLGRHPELAAYREDQVRKALQYGAVQTIILSKDLDKVLVHELKELADNISAEIQIVSSETTEGKQFLNLSGIGAILRFQIQ